MKKVLTSGLALVALLIIFQAQIRLGVLTALFLWDLLDDQTLGVPDHGRLSWVTSTPVVQPLNIRRGTTEIAADLYYVADRKKRAAIVLTHGIIDTGKEDPRLVRFARSLARSGFVVLVPELKGMKSFRILLTDVDDIVASFRLMATREEVDTRKMGLLGFSYGAGPTLIAAADAAIRDQVKFAVSFGGYYDLINVIRFITTGYYEYLGESGFLRPEPYGKWVFFMNNVDYVQNEHDREVLREIFAREKEKKGEEAIPLVRQLSPPGRNLYELLVNHDPHRVHDLVQGIDPQVRAYLRKLSLEKIVPALPAYLLIGHGAGDPLIPYTESLRLADAVKEKDRRHVAIVRVFAHVDPEKTRYSARDFVTVYVPSLARFYRLVYDLLAQQL